LCLIVNYNIIFDKTKDMTQSFNKAKIALRKYLMANKEQVKINLN